MNEPYLRKISLPRFCLWEKIKAGRKLISFDLEITARCNNNCSHCYINVPANDSVSRKKELCLSQIEDISEQSVNLGALWCLVTGGEPLLRRDFPDIYLSLKKKGLLVSVFTNATLVNKDIVKLFKEHPPRDIEVTVYGITKETYESVTRKRGSFKAFIRGLSLLLDSKIRVRLKAVALRSNLKEFPKISEFCRKKTKDYFRFDPFLNLRFDGNLSRNQEIISQRLSPEEIVAIEKADYERFSALKKTCEKFIVPELDQNKRRYIFCCGAGNSSFSVSPEGYFRLCSLLWQPDCVYDLKKGSLKKAWNKFVPVIRRMRLASGESLIRCHECSLIDLCMWCPAQAYLETGKINSLVEYFCKIALKRSELLYDDEKQ